MQALPTAQEQAYEHLREGILSGRYRGGTRLNLDEVAAAVGTSRMPVREAVLQLAAEGLVTVRPNRGAVVTELTPEDVIEVFEMRAVLEALAVRVALPRLDAEAFEDLERLVGRMARNAGDAAQWLRHHDEFHDYLCRRSGRGRLVEHTRLLRRSVEPYLRLHVGIYDPPEMVGWEHSRLLQALRAGDAERAERAVRQHVEQGGAHVADFLKRARPGRPAGGERGRPPRRRPR